MTEKENNYIVAVRMMSVCKGVKAHESKQKQFKSIHL